MRRSEPVSVAAGAAAVGGLVAFVGVYLGWFSVTAPAGSGSFGGTADWTGLVAAIAGLLAVVGGGAAVLLRGGVLGTWGAGLASVGGIFAAAMATIALLRLDAVAAEIAGDVSASGAGGAGLWVSLIGGLVATVGGFQVTRATSAS